MRAKRASCSKSKSAIEIQKFRGAAAIPGL
jgi:hypothetical protein